MIWYQRRAALIVSLCITGLTAFASCKEKSLHPELTAYSEPVDGVLPYFQGVRMDPYWPKARELPVDLRRMTDSPLRSHEGRTGSGLAQTQGKYSLVTFFYTTCRGICPMITQNAKTLSSQIKDQSDLQFLSISIDPEVDDEKALRSYRARQNVMQDNWTFFTGGRHEIERLAREQFAGEIQMRSGKEGLVDFVHTENIFLLDKQGYLRGIYRARGTGDFPRLLKDLQTIRETDAHG